MLNNCSINTNMNTMKGLTLIELMVTLAVFAVLVAVGLPQMQGISTSNRLASHVNALSGDINFARSEAINRNTNISITANGGDWGNGWNVVIASNLIDPPPKAPLRSAGPVPAGFTITELNNSNTLTYQGDGTRPRHDRTALNFTVCEPDSNRRLLDISAVGRVSYSTGAKCP